MMCRPINRFMVELEMLHAATLRNAQRPNPASQGVAPGAVPADASACSTSAASPSMKRGCTPRAGDADVGRDTRLVREFGIVAVELDQGLDMLRDERDRVDDHADAVGARPLDLLDRRRPDPLHRPRRGSGSRCASPTGARAWRRPLRRCAPPASGKDRRRPRCAAGCRARKTAAAPFAAIRRPPRPAGSARHELRRAHPGPSSSRPCASAPARVAGPPGRQRRCGRGGGELRIERQQHDLVRLNRATCAAASSVRGSQ